LLANDLESAEPGGLWPGSIDWYVCASDWLSGASSWPDPAEWVGDAWTPTPLDLTGIVRQWTTNRVNLGLLAKGTIEGRSDDLWYDNSSIRYYNNFKLEVHFYE